MKILLLQDYLRSGGTERQSVLLANAFAAAGHETMLLTFRPAGPLATTVAPNVRRHSTQSFDWRLDWFATGMTSAVSRFGPDVILCMGRMANCYGSVLQRKHPASTVIATMRTGKPLPLLFRRSLQSVRHVIANSHEAKQTLVDGHQIPAAKISVIHNSLVFPAETGGVGRNTGLRQRHGASSSTTVFLCVAMFRPEKNQRELVEIVAGLPPDADWQLWLAGDGTARSGCEQLVAEKNLGSRVKFLGFQRDPSPLYAAADIAVHASWSEALSNFLIEAQARGLPAVAYQAQGITECFLPGDTGFAIARDDRTAFRGQLLRLLHEPAADRSARADRARAYARATFDPARQVAAYLELFQKLTATSGS
ncbi:MAG TPA: glycosyltransferase [Opitutaceae bacterium]|nr:glycosyltransferase [Opitutaceae bacterium]